MNFNITESWLRGKLAKTDDGYAGAGIPLRSCFVCGQTTLADDVAVQHLIYREVICCERCKSASEAASARPTTEKP